MGAESFPVSFGTQSDPGRYGPEAGPEHINAYAELVKEGRPVTPLYSVPGLDLFATITNGGRCRGLGLVDDNTLLVLSGNVLATVEPGGSVTSRGTITGNKDVIMATNGANPAQVAIVQPGGGWWVYSNGTLTEAPDADLPTSVNSVLFLDQRVIFTQPDGTLWWSDLNNSSSIGALSFASAEAAPDGLVRGFRHRLDAWLFGKTTTEIWRSTADTDAPFLRVSGGFIQKGCGAPFSVASLGETVFWIADDDIPYAAPGYTATPLMHGPVCRDIEDTADKDSIIGSAYYLAGNGFWELSGPTWCWIFNVGTQQWFRRKSYGRGHTEGGHITPERYIGVHAQRFQSDVVVGDYNTNKIYKLNRTTFNENGDILTFEITSPAVNAWPNRVSVDRFYADFVTGVGLNSTDEEKRQPMVIMDYSDDGGRTWSAPIPKPLGEQGDYTRRVVWNKLGVTGRQGRRFRLRISSDVIRGFLYAAIDGDRVGT